MANEQHDCQGRKAESRPIRVRIQNPPKYEWNGENGNGEYHVH